MIGKKMAPDAETSGAQGGHASETDDSDANAGTRASPVPLAESASPCWVSYVEYPTGASKRYECDAEGSWSKTLTARAPEGKAIVRSYESFAQFADERRRLPATFMQLAGTFESSADGLVVRYGRDAGPNDVAATGEFLQFRDEPCVLVCDTDVKDADEVHGLFLCGESSWESPEQFITAIEDAVPELAGVAVLCGDSTSSQLYANDNPRKDGPGGFHTFWPVASGALTKTIADRIFARLLAAGLGWGFIDKAGQVHIRTPLDMAMVNTPTQPNFCAPVCGKGVEQRRRWFAREQGGVLGKDIQVAWNRDHEASANRYVTKIRKALQAKAEKIKTQRDAAIVAKLTRNSQDREYVDEVMQALQAHVLTGELILTFPKPPLGQPSEITVVDLLRAGEAYDELECYDPLEPDYDGSRAVGKFYWNNGAPAVNSFAHGQRCFMLRYDRKSLPEVTAKNVGQVLALFHPVNPAERAQLIKTTATALKLKMDLVEGEIAFARKKMSASRAPLVEDESQVFSLPAPDLRPGEYYPRSQPLPLSVFKFTEPTARGGGTPMLHVDNIATMLRCYGLEYHYDVIHKRAVRPSDETESDNASEAFIALVLSLANLNSMPTDRLQTMLTAVADKHQVNPVTDHLKSLSWDGKRRIKQFAEQVASAHDRISQIAMRLFFIQACAAADAAEIGRSVNADAHAVFEYVLVFHSAQGMGKTKGLVRLVPSALRKYVKTSGVLHIGDRDSERDAVSYWIVELGELDATFRKSDLAAFKAFCSRPVDEMRLPYAATASRFRRRAVFVGTVNDPQFLHDPTGNRRILPLHADRGLPVWDEAELEQLWAEAWAAYVAGEQWWPSDDAQEVLAIAAQDHTATTPIFDLLQKRYDWNAPVDSIERHPIYEVLAIARGEWLGLGKRSVSSAEQTACREALFNLWGLTRNRHREIEVRGRTHRIYQTTGNNAGFLMPPLVSGFEKVFEDEEFGDLV